MIRRAALKLLLRKCLAPLALLLVLWLCALPGPARGQDETPESEEPVDVVVDQQEPRQEADGAGNMVEGDSGVQKEDGEAKTGEGQEPTDEQPAGQDGAAPPPAPVPEPDSAGNIADQGEAGGTAGDATGESPGGLNIAESGSTGGGIPGMKEPPPRNGASPPPPPTERRTLPPFAEEQPGFIPDTLPEDLFQGERKEFYLFDSPLGSQRVPQDDVGDIISSNSSRLAGDLEPNYARVVVPNGNIEGSTETKQFHITGGLTIYYRDVSISGDEAEIDEKNEVARLTGDVNIVDPKYRLKTDELLIYFSDKKFQASGFVSFSKLADRDRGAPDLTLPKKDRLREHFAAQQFELFCQELYYDWDSLEMTAVGSVRLVHPSFNGTMDRLDYNDETKDYVIDGDVILEVSDYRWIFANKLVEPDDEKKVQAITDGTTKIRCARLVYSEESSIAEFYALPGQTVSFEQPKRYIRAAYIEVNDNTKDFYAESDGQSQVQFHQTDGEWLIQGGLIEEEGLAPELEEMLSGEVTTQADTLTYNFDRKRMELKGDVSVVGSGHSLQAQNLVQDETSDYFLLQGNVLLKPDEDSTIYAAQVFFDTERDIVTFVGLVEGRITSDQLPTSEQDEGGEEGGAGGGGIQIQQGVFQQVGSSSGSRNPSSGNIADR